MKWLIGLFRRMIVGSEVGTCCYLWTGVCFHSPVSVSFTSLVLITLMGAIVGGATIIFQIPQLNHLVALTIHFLLTIVFSYICLKPVVGKYFQLTFQSLMLTIFLYCIVWLIVRFTQIGDVQRVNYRLRQYQKKNH